MKKLLYVLLGLILIIVVAAVAIPIIYKDDIKAAIDAELDASGIQVEVVEGTVKLEGKVRYLGERRSAERAAWAVPGVTNVIDNLAIQ